MPEFISQILQQSKTIWQQLTGGQRLVIVSVFFGVMALLAGLVWYGSRPDMVPLTSGLSGEDLAKVQDVLAEKGVAYRAGGNSTILVPRDQEAELRMLLAMKGVNRAGQGWDMLDNMSFTAPRFLFRQKEIVARCQVISEAIRSIVGIENASVNAIVPKKPLFTEAADLMRVKASVVIHMRKGVSPKPFIPGIVNLVSSAIERLEPKNVTIVDGATGKHYTANADGEGSLAGGLDEVKRRAAYLEHKVQGLLDRSIGPGKTAVSVNLEMDLVKREERLENIDKDKKALVREKTMSSKEPLTGSSGDPTVASQVRGRGSGTRGGGLAKTNEESEKDYVYPKTTTLTKDPGGKITSLTASVMVDKGYIETLVDQTVLSGITDKAAKAKKLLELVDAKFDLELKSKIKKVVAAAIGSVQNKTRRDQIEVEAVFFPKPEIPDTGGGGLPMGMIGQGVQILGAVVVLFFLRGLLKKGKKAAPEMESRIPEEKAGDEEEDNTINATKERKRYRREIEKSVASDPGAVGRLLAGWLQEK